MSIKIMNEVWKYSTAKASDLLVLLSIADSANEETREAFPSIKQISNKTRLSSRQVQYSLRRLEKSGELKTVFEGGTKRRNLFTISYLRAQPLQGAEDAGCKSEHIRVQMATSKGANGDIPTILEPSFNHQRTNSPQPTAVNPRNGQQVLPDCPHEKIIAFYHAHCPTMRKVRVWPSHRQKLLKTRWRENPDLEWWDTFLAYCGESKFLAGKNDRGWAADLEWILKPRNFCKIQEGAYHR
ncbi:MAG: helix-turn-helix domain-containing protein [Nitrososphaera sp.]|nr:helix-turn-helix domain-containing protein [Nitrososphaera sp.]